MVIPREETQLISLLGVEGDSVQFVNQGNLYLVSAVRLDAYRQLLQEFH